MKDETVSAHTPGPWDLDEGDLTVYALDERGGSIPLFQPHEECDGEVMSFAEATDNARLIAAAPDLLEALRAVELNVDGLNTKGFPQKAETQAALNRIKAHCRAAISKAEARS